MRKAYSLIEAVLAISVLTIIISVGVSIIFVSSDTESTNEDLLIGNTLAAEGAEAMKGIYYTNILKYGEDDIDDCGLLRPGFMSQLANCVPRNQFYDSDDSDGSDSRYYLLERRYSPSGSENNILTWNLSFPGASDRNESIVADGVLNDDDAAYRISIDNKDIGQLYTHSGSNPSKFYREILTVDNGTSVLISSRVHWVTSSGSIRTVENSFELPE